MATVKKLVDGLLKDIKVFLEEKKIDIRWIGEDRTRAYVAETLYHWTITDNEDDDRAQFTGNIVCADEIPEFIGNIIDGLEDFLEERGIDIPNPEKDEQSDDENTAIIYGDDYGNLSFWIEETLVKAKAIESRW